LVATGVHESTFQRGSTMARTSGIRKFATSAAWSYSLRVPTSAPCPRPACLVLYATGTSPSEKFKNWRSVATGWLLHQAICSLATPSIASPDYTLSTPCGSIATLGFRTEVHTHRAYSSSITRWRRRPFCTQGPGFRVPAMGASGGCQRYHVGEWASRNEGVPDDELQVGQWGIGNWKPLTSECKPQSLERLVGGYCRRLVLPLRENGSLPPHIGREQSVHRLFGLGSLWI
jgi:hypothetical protein